VRIQTFKVKQCGHSLSLLQMKVLSKFNWQAYHHNFLLSLWSLTVFNHTRTHTKWMICLILDFIEGNIRLMNCLPGSWVLLKKLCVSKTTMIQWGVATILGFLSLYRMIHFLTNTITHNTTQHDTLWKWGVICIADMVCVGMWIRQLQIIQKWYNVALHR
jgi:hypothetical protein